MSGDANEMVVLELAPDALLRLYSNITGRMQSLGMNSADWRELGEGLDLPAGWPIDKDARPTLAQLVVIARKLRMRITIRELSMQPLSETKESQPADGLGMNSADWRELGEGLELPAGWPIDKDARPTLAQLVVVARTLRMRITIRELSMQPLSETKESQPAGGLGKEATDGYTHDRGLPSRD